MIYLSLGRLFENVPFEKDARILKEPNVAYHWCIWYSYSVYTLRNCLPATPPDTLLQVRIVWHIAGKHDFPYYITLHIAVAVCRMVSQGSHRTVHRGYESLEPSGDILRCMLG